MKLIEFEVTNETSNHVFFQIQYTNWWNPSKIITKLFVKNKKNNEFYNRINFSKPFRAQEIVFDSLIEYHKEILSNAVVNLYDEK